MEMNTNNLSTSSPFSIASACISDPAASKQSLPMPNVRTINPKLLPSLPKYDAPSCSSKISPHELWQPFEEPPSPILAVRSDSAANSPWCVGIDRPVCAAKSSDNRFDDADCFSPEGHNTVKYHISGAGDIRQQLLVQRTFNPHDDHAEPKTSSPMRKVRVCTINSGISTVTVSPSSGATLQHGSNIATPTGHELPQSVFKTPVRNQRHNDDLYGITPSRNCTPMYLSPAGTTYNTTPGRKFENPFEIGHDRLHMPIFSPNLFKVKAKESNKSEGFWSMEHAAVLMPVDIKEAEIRRQHALQQKLDKEQDAQVQSAINKFFANEVIVPSPWSEKASRAIPRTPVSVKSVSCQTTMSVPPSVDLKDELQGKYQLGSSTTDSPPASETSGMNSFIRRKLLHQLNNSDSNQCSPALSGGPAEDVSSSPSPVKQTTPEWEKDTQNGHFSSSPIDHSPYFRGQGQALSETELLASPELYPVRASKSLGSPDGFFPPKDSENSRTVMHLEFSSILDDSDDSDKDDKEFTGTMVQKVSSGGHLIMESSAYNVSLAASQDSDSNTNRSEGFSRKSFLASLTSTESNNEIISMPQTSSSLDTGYQTASLQSTHQDCGSNSATLDTLTSVPTRPFEEVDLQLLDHVKLMSSHSKDFKQFKQDGSFMDTSHRSSQDKSSSVDDIVLLRTNQPCRIRKVRTLADIRQSKVSRDLTHSFNEELEKFELSRMPTPPQFTQYQLIESLDAKKFGGFKRQVNSPSLGSPVMKEIDILDVSMRSSSPYFDISSRRSSTNLEYDSQGSEERPFVDQSTPCRPQNAQFFPLRDDTLHAARLLLEKSIELPESQPDYFRAFHNIENQDPNSMDDVDRTVTPSSRIFNSFEKKLSQIESSKLGSEIAAEIIKRAESDLAELTNLMDKSTPRS